MISAGEWIPNQANTIRFTLVNAEGIEVAGLGTGWSIVLCKPGEATFTAGAGTKAELGLGAYEYTSTPGEADTGGTVYAVVTGAGIIQQNLEYVIKTRVVAAREFTYTLTDDETDLPIPDAEVWFSTDSRGYKVVWVGMTGVDGIAKDMFGELPWLAPGSYYIHSVKAGYVFPIDTEVVT